MSFETVEFGREHFTSQVALDEKMAAYKFGPSVRQSAELRVLRDGAHNCVIQLHALLLGRTVKEEMKDATFSYPATWWQHFKQEHCRDWITRRWPVKMRTVTKTVNIRLFDVYPEADYVAPEGFGGPVRFQHSFVSEGFPRPASRVSL